MHVTFPPATNGKTVNKTKAMAAEAVGFNYNGVPTSTAAALKKIAAEIRELKTRAVTSMLDIGRLLSEARRTLRTPVYKAWLQSELHLGYSTAANFIAAANAFQGLPPEAAERIDPKGLIELSRSRVSPAARAAAVTLANSGQRVTRADSIALADEYRGSGEASQVELDSLYRLRSSLRQFVRSWEGEQIELARRVLLVVREVLAEASGENPGAYSTPELQETALGLGVML
jgi:hypothetical protein